MHILAFETSCDDTSIALFEDGQLRALETRSQGEHNETGGVVPEIAARLHANVIFDVLDSVFQKVGWDLATIDLFACTREPGLIPSLLVGRTVAQTLSQLTGKPLLWINHIEAHMYALWLERKKEDISFPCVCLTASGGHNEIYHLPALHVFEKIGETRDDSAGEAFDKVSTLLGMGYPGGPAIEKKAQEFRGSLRSLFPRPLLDSQDLSFSFSGLKSAVRREVEVRGGPEQLIDTDRAEISAEFQSAVIDTLATKLLKAALQKGAHTVALTGGVAANTSYREAVIQKCSAHGLRVIFPEKKVFCMDNAAMVGMAAYLRFSDGLY